MASSDSNSRPDRRTHAWRDDMAAEALRGIVDAPRFVAGTSGRVCLPILSLRKRPDALAPLETEALFGEPMSVLDVQDGWAWVQSGRDSYVGYVRADGISSHLAEPSHRIQALGTFVYPETNIKAPPTMHLPLGAEVAVVRSEAQFAELASGGFVVTRHIVERTRHARDFVDVAERFIGTPYLWGGRTRIGLDCSGLLQIALEAAGIAAPRDTDMQETALGSPVLVPQDLEGLERGDLVFWPGHVGIMVDGVMLLHANAHHMAVAVEPLSVASERIRRTGSRISAIKRLTGLSAVA
jgi:cell wall-associated NlpC family hydrolase